MSMHDFYLFVSQRYKNLIESFHDYPAAVHFTQFRKQFDPQSKMVVLFVFFSSYGQQKHLFDMICKKQNVVMSTEQSGGKNLEVRN